MPPVSLNLGLAVLAAAALTACLTPGGNPCSYGQAVTIPAGDPSPPLVAVELFLPDGRVVSMAPGTAPQAITSTSAGQVTIVVKSIDPQGSQDVQVWVEKKECTTAGDDAACTSGGLLAHPAVSSPDAGTRGAQACTERLVSHTVGVAKTPTRELWQSVTLVGRNFGGQSTTLGPFTLRVQ